MKNLGRTCQKKKYPGSDLDWYYLPASQLTFKVSHQSWAWTGERKWFFSYWNGGILEIFSFGTEKSGASLKQLFTRKILCFQFSMVIFKVKFSKISFEYWWVFNKQFRLLRVWFWPCHSECQLCLYYCLGFFHLLQCTIIFYNCFHQAVSFFNL